MGDWHGQSWLWFPTFKKELSFAKNVAKKISSIVR